MQNEEGIEHIVIVHGAFGGRHQWKTVANALERSLDMPVHRVALTGQGERSHLASRSIDLSTHVADVTNLIDFEQLQSVCLIGHSYGGVVISAVSEKIPERIARRIYLDAYLLENGENFFSKHPKLEEEWTQRANEVGDGWQVVPTWHNTVRDVPHPIATLKQRVELTNELAAKIPSEYWLFTDGGEIDSDSLRVFYERAQQREWPCKSFKWDHNPHRNAPDELAEQLTQAISNP